MPNTFLSIVRAALSSKTTGYLVLGDDKHGERSLKSLAAAVKDGKLRRLDDYGARLVLVEGPRRGDELTFENGQYKDAVEQLRKGYQVTVWGCEDNDSLSTQAKAEAVLNQAAQSGQAMSAAAKAAYVSLLAQRIPTANTSWIAQVKKNPVPKTILCVGSSHLPVFNDAAYPDVGLIATLALLGSGMCYGYAVLASDSTATTYVPENKPDLFGTLEAIPAYPGWNG